jgi:hypothetical protein
MSLYLLNQAHSSRGKRSACGPHCFYEAHESILPFPESHLLTLASSLKNEADVSERNIYERAY